MDNEGQSVKDVIDRILISYGVRTRQAYSDLAKIRYQQSVIGLSEARFPVIT